MSTLTREQIIARIVQTLRPTDPDSWPPNIVYVTLEFDGYDLTLTKERDEADRRAGAAERALEHSKESEWARERWLNKAKDQWGVHRHTSFDVIWAECLQLKKDSVELAHWRECAAGEGESDGHGWALTTQHLKGAMRAQDDREKAAGEKCGVDYAQWGCDWPDAAAEKILDLRRQLKSLRRIVAGVASSPGVDWLHSQLKLAKALEGETEP